MLDKLKEIMQNVVPGTDLSAVTMDTRLQADLGLNSLSVMLLAMGVEDAFGIRFDEAGNLMTVGDVCDYIQRQLDRKK